MGMEKGDRVMEYVLFILRTQTCREVRSDRIDATCILLEMCEQSKDRTGLGIWRVE